MKYFYLILLLFNLSCGFLEEDEYFQEENEIKPEPFPYNNQYSDSVEEQDFFNSDVCIFPSDIENTDIKIAISKLNNLGLRVETIYTNKDTTFYNKIGGAFYDNLPLRGGEKLPIGSTIILDIVKSRKKE